MQRLLSAGITAVVVMTALQFVAADPANAFAVRVGRTHTYGRIAPGYSYINPGYTDYGYVNPGYGYVNPGYGYGGYHSYNRGFGNRRSGRR